MSQLVACPECRKHLQVPDDLIGKKVQCPECKHTFTAAAPEEPTKISTIPPKPPTPSKAPAWDKDDDDERASKSESRPKKHRDRDDDDDDDDDDDRPRRRRRSSSGRNYVPHRGGMILAFGLIGLLIMPIFGVVAWVMGNSDLAEMRAGNMDPEGESMTNAGRILGMIAVAIWVLSILVFCGFFGCFFMIGIGAAAGGNRRNNNFPPPPQRRF